MEAIVIAGVAIVALVAGAVLGWVFAGRTISPLREERDKLAASSEEWRGKYSEAVVNLAAEAEKSKRLAEVEEQLAVEREANGALTARLAGITAQQEERDRQHAERTSQLEGQFKQLATAALEQTQGTFLSQAEDRIGNALKPVRERLQKYEEQVARVEQDRTEAYGNIKGLVEAMHGRLETLTGETSRLVLSLKGNPKTPGDWGQHHFENLIELAQLTEHVDYEKEKSIDCEEGSKRPDFIIHLPEGGRLVVDVKCSLDHYLSAASESDKDKREAFLEMHAGAVKKHATDLAKKSYYEDVAGSPDYVIMYIPGDHYFGAAMQADPGLWKRAADKRVIIASPGTFLPLAHSLAAMWRSYKLNEDAQKIGRLGKEMHDRLAVAADHLRIVGSGLGTAVKNYNKFVGSFERNVMTTGRKFRDLAIESGAKELSEVQIVEALAQYADDEPVVVSLDDPPLLAIEKVEDDDED